MKKLEMLIGRIVLRIIESVLFLQIGYGLLVVIGYVKMFLENHWWAFAMLIIIDLVIVYKILVREEPEKF